MHLTFTPIRMDQSLEIAREQDTLIVNGQRLDFSQLAAAATLPLEDLDCAWIARDPYRDADGVLHLTVMLPYGPDAAPARMQPSELTVTGDGPVPLP